MPVPVLSDAMYRKLNYSSTVSNRLDARDSSLGATATATKCLDGCRCPRLLCDERFRVFSQRYADSDVNEDAGCRSVRSEVPPYRRAESCIEPQSRADFDGIIGCRASSSGEYLPYL